MPAVQAWPARRRLAWTRVVPLAVSPALAGLAAPCASAEGAGMADVVEGRARALISHRRAFSAGCSLLDQRQISTSGFPVRLEALVLAVKTMVLLVASGGKG